MKKRFLFVALVCAISFGCSKSDTAENSSGTSSTNCGSHNGKSLNRGPEGGCYYINSSGNKTYVDRSECKCN